MSAARRALTRRQAVIRLKWGVRTMDLRENAAWALIVPTSMGVRLTPDRGQPVHSSHRLTMEVTSAETNGGVDLVVSRPAGPVLTAFVEGSPIAAFIKSDLAARHMVTGPEVPQGSAWGTGISSTSPTAVTATAARACTTTAPVRSAARSTRRISTSTASSEEGAQILHLSGWSPRCRRMRASSASVLSGPPRNTGPGSRST